MVHIGDSAVKAQWDHQKIFYVMHTYMYVYRWSIKDKIHPVHAIFLDR